MMVTQRGAGLFIMPNAYLVIPHMQDVFDGACALPPDERDTYIASRSILILTRLNAMSIDRGVLQLKTDTRAQHGTTYFFNLQTLPLISPDMPPPTISGRAMRRAAPDGWCAGPLEVIDDGGATLEIMRQCLSDGETQTRYNWGSEWCENVHMMLRITTFTPRV